MVPVSFSFVPPGGGENDYSMEASLPSIPQPGDYILINKKDDLGYSGFIVRRSWWYFKNNNGNGQLSGVTVECEFAKCEPMNDAHKQSCEMYSHSGKIQTMQASTF